MADRLKSEVFFRLEKLDPFQGIAYGVAAAEEPDRDNEILAYEESKPYFQAWSKSVNKDTQGKSFGNVRFQHDDKRPVGKVISPLEFDDVKKEIRIVAKIVEKEAVELLREGCLGGFSIGGSYVKRTPVGNGLTRYVANPAEISVVDRPCAPSATFSVVKSDGSVETRSFKNMKKQKILDSIWSALEKTIADNQDGDPPTSVSEQKIEAAQLIAEAAARQTDLSGQEEHQKKSERPVQQGTNSPANAADAKIGNKKDQDGEPGQSAMTFTPGSQEANNVTNQAPGVDAAHKARKAEKKARKAAERQAEIKKAIDEAVAKVKGGGLESTATAGAPGVTNTEGKDPSGIGQPGDPKATESGANEADSKIAAKVSGGGPESTAVAGAPGVTSKEGMSSAGVGGTNSPANDADAKFGDEKDDDEQAVKAVMSALEKALTDTSTKLSTSGASYERVLAKVTEFKKSLGQGTKMDMSKAHKSVIDHCDAIEKAVGACKAAHERMHKSQDDMLSAHNGLHTAQKSAFEARQVHKAAQDAAMSQMMGSLDGIKKVLGGGPESEYKPGVTGTEGMSSAGVGGTNSPANDVDSKISGKADKTVKTPEQKAAKKAAKKAQRAAELQKAVADAVAVAKGDKVAALAEPLTEEQKMKKAVADTLKTIFEAIGKAAEPEKAAPVQKSEGVGDRKQAVAFGKAQDNGTVAVARPNEMTQEDWAAYQRGDGRAIAKAQSATASKWQEVPSRILRRMSK